MNLADPVEQFVAAVRARLEHGAREYGNRSFLRSVASIEKEILEEQVDQVGWCFILWSLCARKTDWTRDPLALRQHFEDAIRHRIAQNDRRDVHADRRGPLGLMADVEVLVLDLFAHWEQLRRRVAAIARALEVAQAIPNSHGFDRGRYGGARRARSDD